MIATGARRGRLAAGLAALMAAALLLGIGARSADAAGEGGVVGGLLGTVTSTVGRTVGAAVAATPAGSDPAAGSRLGEGQSGAGAGDQVPASSSRNAPPEEAVAPSSIPSVVRSAAPRASAEGAHASAVQRPAASVGSSGRSVSGAVRSAAGVLGSSREGRTPSASRGSAASVPARAVATLVATGHGAPDAAAGAARGPGYLAGDVPALIRAAHAGGLAGASSALIGSTDPGSLGKAVGELLGAASPQVLGVTRSLTGVAYEIVETASGTVEAVLLGAGGLTGALLGESPLGALPGAGPPESWRPAPPVIAAGPTSPALVPGGPPLLSFALAGPDGVAPSAALVAAVGETRVSPGPTSDAAAPSRAAAALLGAPVAVEAGLGRSQHAGGRLASSSSSSSSSSQSPLLVPAGTGVAAGGVAACAGLALAALCLLAFGRPGLGRRLRVCGEACLAARFELVPARPG